MSDNTQIQAIYEKETIMTDKISVEEASYHVFDLLENHIVNSETGEQLIGRINSILRRIECNYLLAQVCREIKLLEKYHITYQETEIELDDSNIYENGFSLGYNECRKDAIDIVTKYEAENDK